MRLASLILACAAFGADRHESLRLGNDLIGQGRYAEALPHLHQALVGAERADSLAPEALKLLGRANQQLGRYAESERCYKRALAFFRPADAPDPRVVVLLSNLLSLYVEQNRAAPAQSIVARLVNVNPGQLRADGDDVRLLYTNLAGYYALRGKYAEAESMLLRAIDVSGGASAEQEAAILNNLAAVAFVAGRDAAAVKYLERALALFERSMNQHPTLAKVLANLGVAYDRGGREADAEAAFGRALSIAKSSLPEIHPSWPEILSGYAALLRKRGRKEEAGRLEVRARMIRDRLRAEDLSTHSVDWSELQTSRR